MREGFLLERLQRRAVLQRSGGEKFYTDLTSGSRDYLGSLRMLPGLSCPGRIAIVGVVELIDLDIS